MGIGEKIKLAREKKGWSQEDLAQEIGVETPTISRWETGTNEPRSRQWPRITDVLGFSREWFEGIESDSVQKMENLDEKIMHLENRLNALEVKKPIQPEILSAWQEAEVWRRAIAMFFLTGEKSHLDKDVPEEFRKRLLRGLDAFLMMPKSRARKE